MENKDTLSVDEAAALYEERNRRARRVAAYVVTTGAAVLASVVAFGVAGLEQGG